MKQKTLIVGIVLVGISLTMVFFATKQSQELRQRASVPGGNASITLSPGSSTIVAGTPTTIALAATIPNATVDGIQFVAEITGAPVSNLTFSPSTPSGLLLIPPITTPITDGTKFQVAFVSQDPTVPLSTNTIVSLGSFTFTPITAGTVSMQFDTVYSKVAQHQTTSDILGTPSSYAYTIVPIPTPTGIPTPTIQPSPTIVPTVTVVPTPSPFSTVEIYAAGQSSNNVYPTIQLMVNGVVLNTWPNVRGNPDLRKFLVFKQTLPRKLTASDTVEVAYINDVGGPSVVGRRVRIDKIVVDGVTYQSEDITVYSTGTFSSATRTCVPRNAKSEWLHCNGSFRYTLK